MILKDHELWQEPSTTFGTLLRRAGNVVVLVRGRGVRGTGLWVGTANRGIGCFPFVKFMRVKRRHRFRRHGQILHIKK